ncbi:MAG: GGDEF domain-containing protein [Proteobacteria bacterium]|nr:GGDEF domain-containing protein [Pseudomonadota bacterium]
MSLLEQSSETAAWAHRQLTLARQAAEANHYPEAAAHAAAVVTWARTAQASNLLCLALGTLTHQQTRLGHYAEAVRNGEEALRLLPQPSADPAFRVDLHSMLALAYGEIRLGSQSLHHAMQAMEAAQEADDPLLRCQALVRLGDGYCLVADPERGIPLLREALAQAQWLRDPGESFRAANALLRFTFEWGDRETELGHPLIALQRYREALPYGELAGTLAAASGKAFRIGLVGINRCHLLLRLAHWDEVLALLATLEPACARQGMEALLRGCRIARARAMLGLGQRTEAVQLLLNLLDELATEPEACETIHQALYEAYKTCGVPAAALHHHEQMARLQSQRHLALRDLQTGVLLARTEDEANRLAAERAALEAEQQRLRARQLEVERDALARQASEMRRRASEDPLTGLPNRRSLDQALVSQLHGLQPGAALAMLLIDLDHFKRVNDTYGHGVGDDVLCELANLLRADCRPHDLPARLGGEEFAVLLSGVDVEVALAVAERLRTNIEAHDWAQLADGLAVTTSIGVALIERPVSVREVLDAADAALYRAKSLGRNRVVLGTHGGG